MRGAVWKLLVRRGLVTSPESLRDQVGPFEPTARAKGPLRLAELLPRLKSADAQHLQGVAVDLTRKACRELARSGRLERKHREKALRAASAVVRAILAVADLQIGKELGSLLGEPADLGHARRGCVVFDPNPAGREERVEKRARAARADGAGGVTRRDQDVTGSGPQRVRQERERRSGHILPVAHDRICQLAQVRVEDGERESQPPGRLARKAHLLGPHVLAVHRLETVAEEQLCDLAGEAARHGRRVEGIDAARQERADPRGRLDRVLLHLGGNPTSVEPRVPLRVAVDDPVRLLVQAPRHGAAELEVLAHPHREQEGGAEERRGIGSRRAELARGGQRETELARGPAHASCSLGPVIQFAEAEFVDDHGGVHGPRVGRATAIIADASLRLGSGAMDPAQRRLALALAVAGAATVLASALAGPAGVSGESGVGYKQVAGIAAGCAVLVTAGLVALRGRILLVCVSLVLVLSVGTLYVQYRELGSLYAGSRLRDARRAGPAQPARPDARG